MALRLSARLPAGSPATAPPDARLCGLLDGAASVRSAPGVYAAMHCAIEHVGRTLGWPVGHAWVVEDTCAWRSAGVWYDADPDAYTVLGIASLEAAPGVARGHLALALHLTVPEWTNDLDAGGPRAAVALAAGLRGAVAAPVSVDGRIVALLEWFLPDDACPGQDTFAALAELASYVGEVAETELFVPVPAA